MFGFNLEDILHPLQEFQSELLEVMRDINQNLIEVKAELVEIRDNTSGGRF